ncbi:MAG: cell division protein ZapA [Rickettsia sp.]|nr:cell division protein ZapA [Rickettsia sp.]
MSIVTISLANKEFKISNNSKDQRKLLEMVKILDTKLKHILKQNSLAPLDLALVILALKLEEKTFMLEEQNKKLLEFSQMHKKNLQNIKEKLVKCLSS